MHAQAQEKAPAPKKPDKENKLTYQGKTLDQWISLLKDEDKDVRESAALIHALKDENEDVREAATDAIKKIQGK